jgi:hypothetical protein
MCASIFGGDPVTFSAMIGPLEAHDLDTQITFKFASQLMRVIKSIPIANTRVIATNYKVRTSVVAPDDRVEYGFARTGIPHKR